MIYSIYEIQQRIAPVAKQYGVKAVFLFGSYAEVRPARTAISTYWSIPAERTCAVFSLWEHCIATLKRHCKSRSI